MLQLNTVIRNFSATVSMGLAWVFVLPAWSCFVRLCLMWTTSGCCFRLPSGRTCCVLSACLFTSPWTPSTASRPGALTAVLHWGSCLTTAVTPSPPVSLLLLLWVDTMTPFCRFIHLKDHLFVFVCSVCGVGNQYSGADGYQSGLDVLLLFCWHVYVLLRPLADICVWNAALWHVSPQKPHDFLCFVYASWFQVLNWHLESVRTDSEDRSIHESRTSMGRVCQRQESTQTNVFE